MTDFVIVGIDTDGSATELFAFDNSGEARERLIQYTRTEDAGGWDLIQVLDTRDECASVMWSWEREEV